jgi:hypothetical protein
MQLTGDVTAVVLGISGNAGHQRGKDDGVNFNFAIVEAPRM